MPKLRLYCKTRIIIVIYLQLIGSFYDIFYQKSCIFSFKLFQTSGKQNAEVVLVLGRTVSVATHLTNASQVTRGYGQLQVRVTLNLPMLLTNRKASYGKDEFSQGHV